MSRVRTLQHTLLLNRLAFTTITTTSLCTPPREHDPVDQCTLCCFLHRYHQNMTVYYICDIPNLHFFFIMQSAQNCWSAYMLGELIWALGCPWGSRVCEGAEHGFVRGHGACIDSWKQLVQLSSVVSVSTTVCTTYDQWNKYELNAIALTCNHKAVALLLVWSFFVGFVRSTEEMTSQPNQATLWILGRYVQEHD